MRRWFREVTDNISTFVAGVFFTLTLSSTILISGLFGAFLMLIGYGKMPDTTIKRGLVYESS